MARGLTQKFGVSLLGGGFRLRDIFCDTEHVCASRVNDIMRVQALLGMDCYYFVL